MKKRDPAQFLGEDYGEVTESTVLMIKSENTPIPVQSPPLERLNCNVSAYRILYILLMLIRHQSLSMTDLNHLLMENPLIHKTYNSETLTQYMNTLRRLGCEIPRAGSREGFCYRLAKHPFPIDFTKEELQAAAKMRQALSLEPDENLQTLYHELLQRVAWATADPVQEWLRIAGDTEPVPDATVERRREKLSQFRKFCQEDQALALGYQEPGGKTVTMTFEPYRVFSEGTNVYLTGFDRECRKESSLNLAFVTHVRQLPFKVKNKPQTVTVIFQLAGRLAKTYRLYPGETFIHGGSSNKSSQDNDAMILVKSRTVDTHQLLCRLLRYGHYCEVISPDSIRQEMAGRIERLLSVMVPKAQADPGASRE